MIYKQYVIAHFKYILPLVSIDLYIKNEIFMGCSRLIIYGEVILHDQNAMTKYNVYNYDLSIFLVFHPIMISYLEKCVYR